MKAKIKAFYHQGSCTISYVVYDQVGGHAVIIDSVLDYTAHNGRIWTEFADRQIQFVQEYQLTVAWILETHAHADHLSAAHYLKSRLSGKIAVSRAVISIQQTFKKVFNIPDIELAANGDMFDHLLTENEVFTFGALTCQVLNTPGHTNDSVTYLIEDNAFVGDTLFMPDSGTARCDFPGGSASVLFDSINRLHRLPDATRLWMCHDYQPAGRDLEHVTTVAQSKAENIHIRDGVAKNVFVDIRENRDRELDAPQLLYASLQVNIRGGRMPEKETNGKHYLKVPITQNGLS